MDPGLKAVLMLMMGKVTLTVAWLMKSYPHYGLF
jgi:hypothetical protein